MKKITKLSTIIFILISLINLSSCKEHQHTFDEGRIIQEASCLAEGIKEYKCTKCDETKQETINKLEHIYDTTIIKATCSKKGSETKVCKLCNDTIEIELEKKDHNYIDGKCSNCDAKDPNYKEEHTHTESEWIILEEATCTKEGKKQNKCTSCDEVLSEEIIEKIDHTIVIDKAVEATCKNTGLTEGSHCSECGEVFKKQEIIKKLDHTESNWRIVSKPTCAKEGKKQKKCTSCKEILREEIIEKLEHTIVMDEAVEPSCAQIGLTEGSHCSECGEVIKKQETIEKLEHNYVNGKCIDCNSYDPNYVDENASKGLFFELNEDNKSYCVKRIGGCKDTDVIIPSIYKGLPVTSIGYIAFYNCYNLTSIVIPNSVTSIGKLAFYDCFSLTSITIPNSVTDIGEEAFSGCESLERIVIPNSVTSIEKLVFAGCESLERIVVPNSVISIGKEAFAACYSLISVDIPSSVTNMEYDAFLGCRNLTSINVDINNQYYKSIDGNLYSKDGTKLIQYATGKKDTSFVIPNGVTSIGANAFRGSKSLENIVIPNSVTSIGNYAFSLCDNIKSMVIPNSVTSMGRDVFYWTPIQIIYCETKDEPSGWNSSWNFHNSPVVWGYTK